MIIKKLLKGPQLLLRGLCTIGVAGFYIIGFIIVVYSNQKEMDDVDQEKLQEELNKGLE